MFWGYKVPGSIDSQLKSLLNALDSYQPNEDTDIKFASESDAEKRYYGRYVEFDVDDYYYYLTEMPVRYIFTTSGNSFYPSHILSLLNHINSRDAIIEPPAADFYIIEHNDFVSTQEAYKDGTLEEDYGMTEPWTEEDIGMYVAHLKDGNHRVVASLLAGETKIPIYISEDTRDVVDEEDILDFD